MDYTIIQQGDTVQNGIIAAACDYDSQIANLPTDWIPGSTCIVLESSSVWMLGLDKTWHEL